MHCSLELQGAGGGRGDDYIVNTLPSKCEQLTIFYFQETNQNCMREICKYIKFGFWPALFSVDAWILFILGGSAEQENFVPYYGNKVLQVIESYVRNVCI